MPCSIDQDLIELSRANSQVNTHTNQVAYDKTLFDLQSYLAHDLDRVKKGKMLDAGCAYGTQSAYYQHEGWDVYALDADDSLSTKDWWDQHDIEFAKVNLETDDIPWDGFDTILFTEVIEHLCYNPVPALERLYKALKPGGYIICTTPIKGLHPWPGRYRDVAHYRDLPLPWNGYKFEDAHNYLYGKAELVQLFHEVGFSIQNIFPVRQGMHHYLIAQKPDGRRTDSQPERN